LLCIAGDHLGPSLHSECFDLTERDVKDLTRLEVDDSIATLPFEQVPKFIEVQYLLAKAHHPRLAVKGKEEDGKRVILTLWPLLDARHEFLLSHGISTNVRRLTKGLEEFEQRKDRRSISKCGLPRPLDAEDPRGCMNRHEASLTDPTPTRPDST